MDVVIALHRLAHASHRMRIPLLPTLFYAVNRVLFGIVLPPQTKVGHRVKFAYLGLGTVVHRNAVIGDDVIVGSNVTIGGRSGHSQLPVIEAGAYIGTGARVLGPVCIGRNAVIGANAVVLQDVPANSVAAGVPARVIRENIAAGTYR
jgi:serine O-acetyltransferase